MREVSKELVMSQVPKNKKFLVTEKEIEEINKLSQDPNYGQEFIESYMDHLVLMKNNVKNNHQQYLSAVKFFTLVQGGNTLKNAYILTFPDRWEQRQKNASDPDFIITTEASRFNKSKLVNDIREMSAIPIQLIYRHLLHEAVVETANIMRTARSEGVRQKAADTLIRELKPSEDQVLKIGVEDGTKSAIEELRQATERLVNAEKQSIDAGISVKHIAESRIIEGDYSEDES